MSGWLTALGPAGTALALLLLGHVLGDFVVQTDEIATNKHRVGPLLTHAGIVTLVHLVAFLPLLTPRTALLVAFVGGFHLLIDAVSARVRHRAASTAPHLFLGDQLAHLLVLLGGWFLLAPSTWTAAPVVAALGDVGRLPWTELTTGAVYVSAFVFAHEGGNTIVRGVLPKQAPDSAADDLAVGYLIGTLERWIILLLGVAGLWEAIAIVVAVESIARFEELKQRAFAEYFLVGTLTSVLVAIALVVLVSVLV
ncbi:DUF3307 domain-containing protein [Natronomonas salina]|uniref:DUF3307 domain-containing protein n=1 Tax=Natronomonas salina TaxID=1710540 RepID=UPI0015B65946|nr:DUF3307 domain-containing protein [Natronomonas salina]QLD88794.1 DUF3307 domain-containing protein [Natronomonas salina]